MTKHKHQHETPKYPDSEMCDVRHPYWQRAHRDWRFLTAVFVMLAAITVYVMSGSMIWYQPR